MFDLVCACSLERCGVIQSVLQHLGVCWLLKEAHALLIAIVGLLHKMVDLFTKKLKLAIE